MYQLWPQPAAAGSAELDEAALFEAYSPTAAVANQQERAFVRVNFVTSLDGAVTVDGYSRGLSGAADQRIYRVLRSQCDAVLVGAGTLRHEGYGAMLAPDVGSSWRQEHGLAPHPTLVIVSSALDLYPGQEAFAQAPVRPIVLTHAAAPVDRRAGLEEVADVLVYGESSVDLRAGLVELRRRGLASVLCEGGPVLLGTLVAEGLIDELCLTISPLLAGAGPGRIVAGPQLPAPLDLRLALLLAADDFLLSRYTRP